MGTVVQFKFGGTSPGTSVGITLDSNPTAGNKLVALMTCYSTDTNGTLTASGGGSWVSQETRSSGTCRLVAALCESATGGATTVTVSSSGTGAQYISGIIVELSGMETTAFDVDIGNSGTSSGAYSTGTTATPAQSNNLVIGIYGASAAPSMSTPSGYSNISLLDDSSTYEAYSAFYRNITDGSAQSASITSATSTDWAAALLVLKDAGAGGASSDQEGARFGNDDAAEAAHTWAAAQDTNITAPAGQTQVLNMIVNATGTIGAKTFKLQYRRVGDGAWLDMPVQ